MTPSEIRDYIVATAKEQGDIVDRSDDNDIWEYLESLKEVTNIWGNFHRWWQDCITIVKVGDKLIGFDNAFTTGDNSPNDLGWEPDYIFEEYEAYKKIITAYKRT